MISLSAFSQAAGAGNISVSSTSSAPPRFAPPFTRLSLSPSLAPLNPLRLHTCREYSVSIVIGAHSSPNLENSSDAAAWFSLVFFIGSWWGPVGAANSPYQAEGSPGGCLC